MEKEKLNKLNVKLEKDLDEDIIEILDNVQNKTLFTKTAIRLAYQQMVEDVSIAKVREPGLYRSERFLRDVEDFKNNSITPSSSDTEADNHNGSINNNCKNDNKHIDNEDDLDDDELL